MQILRYWWHLLIFFDDDACFKWSFRGVITMPVGFSERFRGLTMGPDGALYAAVDEGKIYKITAE